MAFTAPKVATWIIKTPTTPKLTTKAPAPHGRFLFVGLPVMLIDLITPTDLILRSREAASRRMATDDIDVATAGPSGFETALRASSP